MYNSYCLVYNSYCYTVSHLSKLQLYKPSYNNIHSALVCIKWKTLCFACKLYCFTHLNTLQSHCIWICPVFNTYNMHILGDWKRLPDHAIGLDPMHPCMQWITSHMHIKSTTMHYFIILQIKQPSLFR